MRKYAKTLMKTHGFRWFLRLSIPALILGIHWALGIPFGVSLLLVFGYVVAGTFLLCPPLFLLPFGLVLWPVLFPIFEFYGLRDGCQKKTPTPNESPKSKRESKTAETIESRASSLEFWHDSS